MPVLALLPMPLLLAGGLGRGCAPCRLRIRLAVCGVRPATVTVQCHAKGGSGGSSWCCCNAWCSPLGRLDSGTCVLDRRLRMLQGLGKEGKVLHESSQPVRQPVSQILGYGLVFVFNRV